MIDPVDLQTFLFKIEGGTIAVDLFKIGQIHHQQSIVSGIKNTKQSNFRVALDIEDCLDRFYGGYYSDWACGGQWNRAYQFVQLLATAFKNAHVDVTAFFDGTLKKNKRLTFERNDFRQKTISVLKHIRMIGTPPPKIWWLPPSGIRTTLRNALRSVNIQVAQTVNDHTMEIIEYFQENKLDAILGLHPDYIISNTSRYFSSHDLRLSYKGALETKEFVISRLLASLSLTADHLPFVAVFLGGYILIDDVKLKNIHERIKIDGNLDFEARIRKIAEIVRNSPTTDIDEFIKHLNLAEFEHEIKESVEYYQRKGKFSMKTNQRGGAGKRRGGGGGVGGGGVDNHKILIVEPAPLASETNEDDEAARKILNDVNNLVDEESNTNDGGGTVDGKTTKNENNKKTTTSQFVYTLPAEVIKTSLNRHQRGIMDARIYQLLTKKEIILPQILEDELYREIPSVHLFYRPARQMIYAILFNLYHQKYLCSKKNSSNGGNGNHKKDGKKDNQNVQKPPEIQVAEWLWSPTNDYKKPDIVSAVPLPWAVPTIQRLWFGMAYEDKQRRMKAFLTIMRSDSPLMLNRGYVPQHMLVMACVLRYIVTSPDRNILTRQELDAFLATAFSPQLPHVEYTQELVLPGVHLRGVYLATLFMQGVETASLANDACGVPLPWTMTNPWLFFDGKLFHLKLKMSTIVTTLRELCDDHIEIVLKIERFRKAILEDVEHFLLPAAHMDPMYRPGFLPPPALPVAAAFNKTAQFSLATTATANNHPIYYNTAPPYFSLTPALLGREPITGVNPSITINRNNKNNTQQRTNNNNRKGYQLKVGGIVTGSWAAGGATARGLFGGYPGNRLGNRVNSNLSRFNITNRGKTSVNTRLQRIQNQQVSGNRNSGGGGRMYVTNKLNTNKRNRQKRKEQRKSVKKDKKDNSTGTGNEIASTSTTATTVDTTVTTTVNAATIKENVEVENTSSSTVAETIVTSNEASSKDDDDKTSSLTIAKTDDEILEKIDDSTITTTKTELQNGSNVPASDLVNSICHGLLKEDINDTSSSITKDNKITSSESNDNDKITSSSSIDINNEIIVVDGSDDLSSSTSIIDKNNTSSSLLSSSSTSSITTTITTTTGTSSSAVTTLESENIQQQQHQQDATSINDDASSSSSPIITNTNITSTVKVQGGGNNSVSSSATIKNSGKTGGGTGGGKKSKAKKNGVTTTTTTTNAAAAAAAVAAKVTTNSNEHDSSNTVNTAVSTTTATTATASASAAVAAATATTTTNVVDEINQSGDLSVKG